MKRTKLQRTLAVALATALSVAMLSGCGKPGGQTETEAGTKAPQATQEQAPNDSTEPAGFEHDPVLNDLGEEPICNEKVTITIGLQRNANVEDYDTNYYTLMLEEAANVNIEFMLFPAGEEATEKLQMMMTGGEKLPDIISWKHSDAQAMSWGAEGYIIPLEDFFENSSYYAAEGYERVYNNLGLDIVEYMRTSDGHVWTFPAYAETVLNPPYARMWVYQPWLDALGLEAPTTTEEFYEMLVAFKTQDPNGNGKADEIPLLGSEMSAGTYGSEAWEYLMNAFTHSTYKKDFLVSTDGQLSVSYTEDGWKEGVKYISQLVQEGLFDPVSFTQDATSFQSVINSNGEQLVGAWCYYNTDFISADHPSKTNWRLLEPLKGPDGYQSIPYNADAPGHKAYITSDCEHPEVAFRVLDLMCREDFTITNRWGKQGENWDYVENLDEEEIEKMMEEKNGKPVEYDWENAIYGGYEPYIFEFKSTWRVPSNIHWMNETVYFRTGEVAGGYMAALLQFDEQTLNNPANAYTMADYLTDVTDLIPEEPITKINYESLDDSVEAETILQELKSYVYEKLATWFVGGDVEADWDSYLKDLETIGLSRYLELAQKGWKK